MKDLIIQDLLKQLRGKDEAWVLTERNEEEFLLFIQQYLAMRKANAFTAKEIFDEVCLWGILKPYIQDPTIHNIYFYDHYRTFIERNGQMERIELFDSETEYNLFIKNHVSFFGKLPDNGTLDFVQRDLRVLIQTYPFLSSKYVISFRKKQKRPIIGTDDLVKFGALSPEMLAYLRMAVQANRNMIIIGGTGSGKTTFLNTLLAEVPPHKRIVTIEDLQELELNKDALVSSFVKSGNDCSINKMIDVCQALTPEYVVLNLSSNNEVYQGLVQMMVNYQRSISVICGIHGNHIKDSLENFDFYNTESISSFNKGKISDFVDIVVEVQRLSDGRRVVKRISEVVGFGEKGAKLNNYHAKEYRLDDKFLIQKSEQHYYMQDVFRFNENKKEFESTGWKSLYLEN